MNRSSLCCTDTLTPLAPRPGGLTVPIRHGNRPMTSETGGQDPGIVFSRNPKGWARCSLESSIDGSLA